jgi:hypothetical protein
VIPDLINNIPMPLELNIFQQLLHQI